MSLSSRLLALCSVLLLCACTDAPAPPENSTEALPAFTGASSCRDCHTSQFADWQNSHHDLAMQAVSAATVLGNFDDVEVDYHGAATRFFRRDEAFVVQTTAADGQDEEFELAYTFGVHPLQQYLVRFPGGRLQTLPFAWDSRDAAAGGQRWFHIYGDEYIGPDDPLFWTKREQNWNYMCAECHSTNVDTNYDAGTDTFATSWSEIDVSCESCHGPGSVHNAQAQAENFDSDHGFAARLDDHGRATWQMNLQTGIAERSELAMRPPQQPEACGRCHARRGLISAEYEYGEPLTHTHMPSLLSEPLYFADGQIRDEVYVYGSFLQSRMYQAGVTCSDCHNPHSLQLVTAGDASSVCGQCHLPTRFATAEHHHHEAGTVACVDCHMTSRVYMGVDARRDHSFRVPRPDLSLSTDSPNACNVCHDEQDAEWAAGVAKKWWGDVAGRRPHFAGADALAVVNGDFPGIARATALIALAPSYGRSESEAVLGAMRDGDPLLRVAALRAARGMPVEQHVAQSAALLTDPVRGVRIEAASLLKVVHTQLPPSIAAAFDAAANEYRLAQHAVASRPEAHANLGGFEAAIGNADAALGHYERALAMEPDFTPARINMADALRTAGDEPGGESVLRDGLQRNADDADLRHALGLLLVRTDRQDEGLQELSTAAELQPENARYAYVLGVALNSLGRSDEAIRQLREARQRFPADFEVAWALATMLRDAGRLEDARVLADELASQYPDEPNLAALRESLPAGR